MIAALLLGREGSLGFPGKNTAPVLGRPMMAYPLLAARHAKSVDEVYVSTDSPSIREIAKEYGALLIDRPPELCDREKPLTAPAHNPEVRANVLDEELLAAAERGARLLLGQRDPRNRLHRR